MATKPKPSATPGAPAPVNAFASNELPKGVIRLSQPTLVRHDEIAVGTTVSGKLVAIVASNLSTIKSKLVHLRHESGVEFRVPLSGSIRQAMPSDEKELAKMIGKTLFLKRNPDKNTGGKTHFEFDVYSLDS